MMRAFRPTTPDHPDPVPPSSSTLTLTLIKSRITPLRRTCERLCLDAIILSLIPPGHLLTLHIALPSPHPSPLASSPPSALPLLWAAARDSRLTHDRRHTSPSASRLHASRPCFVYTLVTTAPPLPPHRPSRRYPHWGTMPTTTPPAARPSLLPRRC